MDSSESTPLSQRRMWITTGAVNASRSAHPEMKRMPGRAQPKLQSEPLLPEGYERRGFRFDGADIILFAQVKAGLREQNPL
jgi:hypothetical protein